MGPPCLTYLASCILVVARADLHLKRLCAGWIPSCFQTNQGQENIVSWLAQLDRLRTRSHKRTNRLSKPELYGRDRFESVTFRSFRRLPSQVETGRIRDVYNEQLVHPCRVNLFEKPCPRLWMTLNLRLVHRITSILNMLKLDKLCEYLACLSPSRGTEGGTRLCYVCVGR